jgi:hypothetical protein
MHKLRKLIIVRGKYQAIFHPPGSSSPVKEHENFHFCVLSLFCVRNSITWTHSFWIDTA